ncbi:MAG: GspH/FimT family pseudopilin [Deltaproteobacteria bacterium]|nr:GspH/FimT family pseudopilin [bacterium]MCB9488582.1 GspH/FimT family pseudopilin [Deltaproteobacteria bacterium]
MSTSRRKTSRRAGFTLLELIIVMAIMGATVLVVPSMAAWQRQLTVNNAVRTVAMDMRLARSLAVDGNYDVIVTFNLETHTYSIYKDAERNGPDLYDLYKTVELSAIGPGLQYGSASHTDLLGNPLGLPVQMNGTSDPIHVTFKSNGAALDAGTIYLSTSQDMSAMATQRDRAVNIHGTGNVKMLRFDGGNLDGPWLEFR